MSFLFDVQLAESKKLRAEEGMAAELAAQRSAAAIAELRSALERAGEELAEEQAQRKRVEQVRVRKPAACASSA